MNAINPGSQKNQEKDSGGVAQASLTPSAVKKIAVFLYNMGGPEDTQAVAPFLTELFRDNDLLALPLPGLTQNFVANRIVAKRTPDIQKKYTEIGGGSPQLATTAAVCAKLKEELLSLSSRASSASQGFAVVAKTFEFVLVAPMMRYTAPRARDCLENAWAAGADEVWLFTQYPQCARATTGTSLREIGLLLRENPKLSKFKIRNFARYGDDPCFLDLWAPRIKEEWENLQEGKRHLIVSAHNLPVSYIAQGDPYKKQIYDTARYTLSRLGLAEGIHWTLAWQSAVGPVKWMLPDTRDVIKDLAQKGNSEVLIWPVAFVSDHIETLHEIDIEFAEIAKHEGVEKFVRVRNLNAEATFIRYLADRILKAAAELARGGKSLQLRDMTQNPSGEGCHMQPGGCLCGKYFLSGLKGLKRGVLPERLPNAK